MILPFPRLRAISLFFLVRQTKRARHANDHVSRLRRSTLALAYTPRTKSEEKERLLAVYPFPLFFSGMAPSKAIFSHAPPPALIPPAPRLPGKK